MNKLLVFQLTVGTMTLTLLGAIYYLSEKSIFVLVLTIYYSLVVYYWIRYKNRFK